MKPKLEVKSRRVGGSTYQVPVDVRPERSQALGMRWLVTYSRSRGEKTMTEKLAAEILDAANNRGNAVKKREHAQDGGGQQGLCSLPLVTRASAGAWFHSDGIALGPKVRIDKTRCGAAMNKVCA